MTLNKKQGKRRIIKAAKRLKAIQIIFANRIEKTRCTELVEKCNLFTSVMAGARFSYAYTGPMFDIQFYRFKSHSWKFYE